MVYLKIKNKMKLFTQVNTPNPSKGKEYVVTAEVNQLAFDNRPGPFYLVQEVNKGRVNKVSKANFKEGKFYHNTEVKVA